MVEGLVASGEFTKLFTQGWQYAVRASMTSAMEEQRLRELLGAITSASCSSPSGCSRSRRSRRSSRACSGRAADHRVHHDPARVAGARRRSSAPGVARAAPAVVRRKLVATCTGDGDSLAHEQTTCRSHRVDIRIGRRACHVTRFGVLRPRQNTRSRRPDGISPAVGWQRTQRRRGVVASGPRGRPGCDPARCAHSYAERCVKEVPCSARCHNVLGHLSRRSPPPAASAPG